MKTGSFWMLKNIPFDKSMFAFWQDTAFTQSTADTSIKNGFTQSRKLNVTISGTVPNTEDTLKNGLKNLSFQCREDKKPLGNITISIACDANYSHYQKV